MKTLESVQSKLNSLNRSVARTIRGDSLGDLSSAIQVGPLLFLLIPVLVFGAAVGFFDLLTTFIYPNSELEQLQISIRNADTHNQASLEMGFRLLWIGAFLMLLSVCAGAIGWSAVSVCMNVHRRHGVMLTVLGFICVILIDLVLWDQDRIFAVVGRPYFDGFLFRWWYLPDTLRGRFLSLLNWTNLASSAACIFVTLAACSTLFPPTRHGIDEPYHLAQQMRRLRGLLYCATVVLIARVISTGAWLQWPTAFLDKPSQEAYMSLVLGLTTSWGALFTLMLMATYIPIAGILARRGHQLALQNLAGQSPTRTQVDKWLEERCLIASSSGQLQRAAVILGPLIAGPVGTLLTSLGNASYAGN